VEEREEWIARFEPRRGGEEKKPPLGAGRPCLSRGKGLRKGEGGASSTKKFRGEPKSSSRLSIQEGNKPNPLYSGEEKSSKVNSRPKKHIWGRRGPRDISSEIEGGEGIKKEGEKGG